MSAKNLDGGSLDAGSEEASFFISVINEIMYTPMNLALVAVIAFLVYKIIKDRIEVPHSDVKPQEPELPKLRHDFTVKELREFDGTQPDGRVLLAVNGNVFDVTKGKKFYRPGGPNASFAGRDASRNLATFNVTPNDRDEDDDPRDLNAMEMDSVREWELQFKEKYEFVGRLLNKGEQPTNYSDEDEDTTNDKPAESTSATAPASNTPPAGNTEPSAAEVSAPAPASEVADTEGVTKRTTSTTNPAISSEHSAAEDVK